MRNQLNKLLTIGILFTAWSCSTTKTVTETKSLSETYNSNINRENYYSYQVTNDLTTSWLDRDEALLIIHDELYKLGFTCGSFILYELPDSNRIIIDVYCRGKDLAFVYNAGHFASVEKEQRNIRTFDQDRFKTGGQFGRRESYDNLPSNVIVLQETWYWYQDVKDDSSKDFVNKATIIEILRQDIREAVKGY
jgi:hypothetical protein